MTIADLYLSLPTGQSSGKDGKHIRFSIGLYRGLPTPQSDYLDQRGFFFKNDCLDVLRSKHSAFPYFYLEHSSHFLGIEKIGNVLGSIFAIGSGFSGT